MCAINPTHKIRLIFDVYTADPDILYPDFLQLVLGQAIKMENDANQRGNLRWHVKETDQPAD